MLLMCKGVCGVRKLSLKLDLMIDNLAQRLVKRSFLFTNSLKYSNKQSKVYKLQRSFGTTRVSPTGCYQRCIKVRIIKQLRFFLKTDLLNL